MTNHEIYKNAFSGITFPGTVDVTSERKPRRSSARMVLIAAAVALLLLTTVIAAEYEAISAYFQVFLHGEPAQIEITEYDPGNFWVVLPSGEKTCYSMVSENGERLTVDEILERHSDSIARCPWAHSGALSEWSP